MLAIRSFMKHALGAVAIATWSAIACAQGYPTKSVTIVVPWPAGGPSDIGARPMAKGLQDDLGKPFIVDNRGGAGGNIGSDLVAKAVPDGYTLLITSSAPIVINPSIYKSMPFDPAKDLAPITNLLRVRAIAVTGAKRSPQLPGVPTFAEAGMPGFESYAWYGFFAPAKTPKDVIAKLNAAAIKVMKGSDYKSVLAETGSEFVGDSPENLAAFVHAEAAKWGRIAKQTGATVD
jgi:tripartite-type tricarboxylate transporter receptor subunit TctC